MTDDQHFMINKFTSFTVVPCFQIEGACNEGGRGPCIWDSFSHTEGVWIFHLKTTTIDNKGMKKLTKSSIHYLDFDMVNFDLNLVRKFCLSF